MALLGIHNFTAFAEGAILEKLDKLEREKPSEEKEEHKTKLEDLEREYDALKGVQNVKVVEGVNRSTKD